MRHYPLLISTFTSAFPTFFFSRFLFSVHLLVTQVPEELQRLAARVIRAFYPELPIAIVLMDVMLKRQIVSREDLGAAVELDDRSIDNALEALRKDKFLKKTLLVDPSNDLDVNRKVNFWYIDYRTVRRVIRGVVWVILFPDAVRLKSAPCRLSFVACQRYSLQISGYTICHGGRS